MIKAKNGPKSEMSSQDTYPNVLVVDDENLNIMVAKTLLEAQQVEIEFAMSGKRALKMFKQRIAAVLLGCAPELYQIILLDYSMPDMDGPEVAQAMTGILKGLPPVFKKPRICCVTSYDDPGFH